MLRLKNARRERDVGAIHEDARHLALEAAGLRPSPVVDVMRRGIVLEPGERAWREVGVELRHHVSGEWCAAMPAVALVTDRRCAAQDVSRELRLTVVGHPRAVRTIAVEGAMSSSTTATACPGCCQGDRYPRWRWLESWRSMALPG